MFTKRPKKVRYQGRLYTMTELANTPEAQAARVNRTTIANRIIALGWTPAQAIGQRPPEPPVMPGISRAATKGKWKARIYLDGSQRFLGNYESEEEASAVYRACKALRSQGKLASFLIDGGDPRSLLSLGDPPALPAVSRPAPYPAALGKGNGKDLSPAPLRRRGARALRIPRSPQVKAGRGTSPPAKSTRPRKRAPGSSGGRAPGASRSGAGRGEGRGARSDAPPAEPIIARGPAPAPAPEPARAHPPASERRPGRPWTSRRPHPNEPRHPPQDRDGPWASATAQALSSCPDPAHPPNPDPKLPSPSLRSPGLEPHAAPSPSVTPAPAPAPVPPMDPKSIWAWATASALASGSRWSYLLDPMIPLTSGAA